MASSYRYLIIGVHTPLTIVPGRAPRVKRAARTPLSKRSSIVRLLLSFRVVGTLTTLRCEIAQCPVFPRSHCRFSVHQNGLARPNASFVAPRSPSRKPRQFLVIACRVIIRKICKSQHRFSSARFSSESRFAPLTIGTFQSKLELAPLTVNVAKSFLPLSPFHSHVRERARQATSTVTLAFAKQ